MNAKSGKRSVILCEGQDDLWFISYYLLHAAGWDNKRAKELWRNYQIKPSKGQNVNYLKRKNDTALVWCVGGKDAFHDPVATLNDFNRKYPDSPIDSLVIVRDRDTDPEPAILENLQGYFEKLDGYLPYDSDPFVLKNQTATKYKVQSRDGREVLTCVTPIIIPFDEEGAVETLLINAVQESGPGGKAIVHSAKEFVSSLGKCDPVLKEGYLARQRMVLKAKFSSVIAITNPDHSTGSFQDMILKCPWDKSDTVKEYFSAILTSITSATSVASA